MPVKADVQAQEVVHVIDTYEVTSFFVDNRAQTISIQYAAGYMNGEEFIAVRHTSAPIIEGEAFLAVAGSPTIPGTLYENIKAAVYAALMQHLGITGSVT